MKLFRKLFAEKILRYYEGTEAHPAYICKFFRSCYNLQSQATETHCDRK
mgnify:CR=1 FL=1